MHLFTSFTSEHLCLTLDLEVENFWLAFKMKLSTYLLALSQP